MTWRRVAVAAFACGVPVPCAAHAFGERYDLPAPLGYFVVGATAAVALSFVVAAAAVRGPAPAARRIFSIPLGGFLPWTLAICRLLSVAMLALVLAAGVWGDPHPARNIAPTLVWIIGWVGLSLVVALVGNVWPAIDPWRALFEMADTVARRAGRPAGIALRRPWPAKLGALPAIALFILFAWLEFVDPLASRPAHLAKLLIAWTAGSLAGMIVYGRETWQRNADPLAIYFATLGRFAALEVDMPARRLRVRPWGRALIEPPPAAPVAFVIAMLSTVLFDGLMGTRLWRAVDTAFTTWVPGWNDREGIVLGTIGLLGTWLAFLAAYAAACALTAAIARLHAAARVASVFAAPLVPIVVAYLVAHNLSYVLVQGQGVMPLVSDPFGRGWNLFGTAGFTPNIAIVDARITWHIATAAIVLGHVMSVGLAHRAALREWPTPRQALVASVPLTVLMVGYTAISLLVVADPLVRYRTPDPSYSGARCDNVIDAAIPRPHCARHPV